MSKKKIQKKRCSKLSNVLYLTKKSTSFFDMVFNRQKRQETYDYYDNKYEETEEEKEIFRIMSSRRRKR